MARLYREILSSARFSLVKNTTRENLNILPWCSTMPLVRTRSQAWGWTVQRMGDASGVVGLVLGGVAGAGLYTEHHLLASARNITAGCD